MLLFTAVLVLAPIGTLALVVLALGSVTARFGEVSRSLLGRGAVAGALGAALAAVGFLLVPGIALPGGGTYFFVAAAFLAAFAAAVGVLLAMRIRAGSGAAPASAAPASLHGRAWLREPGVRTIAGMAGAGMIAYGAAGVRAGDGRGAASAIVIGAAGLYWAAAGRVPAWFRS